MKRVLLVMVVALMFTAAAQAADERVVFEDRFEVLGPAQEGVCRSKGVSCSLDEG